MSKTQTLPDVDSCWDGFLPPIIRAEAHFPALRCHPWLVAREEEIASELFLLTQDLGNILFDDLGSSWFQITLSDDLKLCSLMEQLGLPVVCLDTRSLWGHRPPSNRQIIQ